MTEVLRTAVNVTTPLALLGLAAALAYFAYVRRLKHQEKQIDSLPPDQRATAIDQYLTRYGVEGRHLKSPDKLALIRTEMGQRHRRALVYVVVAAVVVVVCFALAVAAYSFHSAEAKPPEAEVSDLREALARLAGQTADLRKRADAYEAKNAHANEWPTPDPQFVRANQQLARDLEEARKKVAEYERLYGALPGADDTLRAAEQVARRASSLGAPMVVIPARIAARHLTPRAREGADQLLNNRPLYDSKVVGWAYSIKRSPSGKAKYPDNSRWHYVDIPVGEQRLVLERDCPASNCLVAAIPRFQKVVRDRTAADEDRREALQFLVCLVAELHQPLHCASRNDAGGNRVRVRVALANHTGSVLNLHQIWDTVLLKERLGAVNVLDYADHLNAQTSGHDRDKWVRGTVEDWAWESHQLAVRHAYDGIAAGDAVVQLGEDYIRRNAVVMERQMMKAGVRLSFLVNEAFD
jgi:hypothetical protein